MIRWRPSSDMPLFFLAVPDGRPRLAAFPGGRPRLAALGASVDPPMMEASSASMDSICFASARALVIWATEGRGMVENFPAMDGRATSFVYALLMIRKA